MLKAESLQTAELLDMLPEEDVSVVKALIKRLIIAWDSDFVKVTPKERERIEKSEEEMKNGDYVTEEEVWA